jgi:peptide/nickel transport system substrate-binding protein
VAACSNAATSAPATTAPTAASATGAPVSAAPASAAASPTAAAAASSGAAGTPVQGGTLTVGVATEPDTLDPTDAAQATSYAIFHQIYDPLVWFDTSSNQYIPDLASSWTTSPDGKTWTFKLAQGVKFQDGTPFNAAAVKFDFDRTKADTKSPLAEAKLGPYTGSKVIDDSTVEIDLSAPYPEMLDSLSQAWLGIQSPAAIQKYGADYGKHPVGTGPMSFVEWVPNDHITIQRNPDYAWGPKTGLNHTGPTYLDKIIFKTVTDNSARTAGLQSGDLQLIYNVQPSDFTSLKTSGDFNMVAVPSAGTPMMIFFNTEKPPLNDIKVRQAILYGVNRTDLIKLARNGIESPAEGPLSPLTLGYTKKVEGMFPFDMAKATSILDQDGWTAGSDGIRAKNGQRLTLDFYSFAGRQQIVTAIQSLLKPLGMDVQLHMLDAAASADASGKGQGNIAIEGVIDTDPSTAGLFFESQYYGQYDYNRIKDPQLDQLFKAQSTEPDPAKRLADLEQIQLYIMNQALVYPMYTWAFLYGLSPKVQGFAADPAGYPYYYDLWLSS